VVELIVFKLFLKIVVVVTEPVADQVHLLLVQDDLGGVQTVVGCDLQTLLLAMHL
jgi:hypothetical protein